MKALFEREAPLTMKVRAWLAVLPAALLFLGAAVASVERVGGQRVAIALPDGPPAGSVILIPGGSTMQKIGADGEGSNAGNFVMRIRSLLLTDGFALAYVEDPANLRALIARMRAIKRPVFLISTSNGTAVAARNAADLGTDGPDGVVLTSTVTKMSQRFPYNAASVNLGKITVPVLFVENTNDGCTSAPPAGVNGLMARFPKGADVTRIDVTSTELMGDPCEPYSPHGYLGIEIEVSNKIVAWMRAHSPP